MNFNLRMYGGGALILGAVALMLYNVSDAIADLHQWHDASAIHARASRPDAIRLLHIRQGPSTILWAVRSVVVDPVKTGSCRARTHIREEIREAIQPAVAHVDATAAVRVPAWIRRVRATSLRTRPAVVFERPAHPVRRVFANRSFARVAAATDRCPSRQASEIDRLHRAAVAPTGPVRMPAMTRRTVNRDEPPEPLPAYIQHSLMITPDFAVGDSL